MTDVVVVGASASGLLTAALLAEAGVRVRVLERTGMTDPSPRTLIVTDQLLQHLPKECHDCIVGDIGQFELYADGKVATVQLARPDLVIERSKLITSLANQASRNGAEILPRTKFVSWRQDGARMVLSVNRGERIADLSTSIVVGADGAFSTVARTLGLSPLETVPLIQAVVQTPTDLPPATSRVWFRPEDTSFFYWLVPEADGRAVLGLIGDPSTESKRRLDKFLAERGLIPFTYQSARIPATGRWRFLAAPKYRSHVYFVGDAAGHVKLSTVGGVVTGLSGAVATADAILGLSTHAPLRRLERELALHRMIHRVMSRFAVDDYRRLFDTLDEEVRTVLGEVTRDEALLLLRRILIKRPRIGAVALRAARGVRQL